MSRYRLPQGVLRAPLEDEEVLLNTDTGVYHVLNRTGHALLASLEEGLTVEEAARRLSDDSGEPLERVSGDADEFVNAMVSRGLLEEQHE